MSFLDEPINNILIIKLTSAGVLTPSLSFSNATKTKSSYFIRKRPEPITAANYKSMLIYGDVSPKPIDELAILVEEVNFLKYIYPNLIVIRFLICAKTFFTKNVLAQT